jgi:hypothetical protein
MRGGSKDGPDKAGLTGSSVAWSGFAGVTLRGERLHRNETPFMLAIGFGWSIRLAGSRLCKVLVGFDPLCSVTNAESVTGGSFYTAEA